MSYFHQESERLRYRAVAQADIPSWTEFFVGNDRLPLIGMDPTKPPEELAAMWVNLQLTRYAEHGLGHLAVELKDSGTLIGMGGILPREMDGRAEFEIAYSVKPAHWGQGYATEIARSIKAHAMAHIASTRFISIIHQDNSPSIKVAQKNGMDLLFHTEYLGFPVVVYGVNKPTMAG